MAVDIAVGHQPVEVYRSSGHSGLNHLLPSLAPENTARGNGLVDQFRSLGEDTARAQGIVSDLGIAHVLVRGQTDRFAVGLEADHERLLQESVQYRSVRDKNSVAFILRPQADAVHDHGHQWAGGLSSAGKRGQWLDEHRCFLM